MPGRTEPLFRLAQIVLWRNEKGEPYKVRIDKMNHKSLGNQWIYSGEGLPVTKENGAWKETGKSIIILNMREKAIEQYP
jgi:hypothetical protein